jgi:ADP-heptose:LPS heptosyltransferase
MPEASPQKILVIRRDNIGDLVCTTPMIRTLRRHYPDAWIAALVTRYNAEVLAGNPDLDAVFAYQKAKHRGAGENRVAIYWQRLKQVFELRRAGIDLVILPASGPQPSAERLARWIGARRVLRQTDAAPGKVAHAVEQCAAVIRPLGIADRPPALVLAADIAAAAAVRQRLAAVGGSGPLLAVHISARKPSQRWPAERFAALLRELHARHGARFLLLWSPGDEDNPLHPGDDRKAQQIVAGTRGLPLLAYPTHALRELIAALSLSDFVVCSDGGAMHLAAGLGKPIACFFGRSDPRVWHPWGVPYVVLQPQSREVTDVQMEDVVAACVTLGHTRTSGADAAREPPEA